MVDATLDHSRKEGRDGFPVVRLSAEVGFEQAIALVAGAIGRAAADGQPFLLVDARAVGFASPSLAERHRFMRAWAEASNGKVRVALIARPAFIDPHRFGVVVAANFGLVAQVFDCEDAACAWLHDPTTLADGPAVDVAPARNTSSS